MNTRFKIRVKNNKTNQEWIEDICFNNRKDVETQKEILLQVLNCNVVEYEYEVEIVEI